MKNDYWSKRLANEYWNIYNDTSKYQKELIKIYKKANEEILAELYKIAAKFEENGVVSRSEFYKAEHLKRMEKGFNDVLRELGEKVEYKGSKIILNAGKDVVLSTGESLGIDINYNEDLAKKLLQTNWKGSNFSKRVWKNSKKLEKELNTQVKKGILMGKPTAQIAIELDKSMGVGLTNTARLVRTETMHHMNDVNLQNMKASGVKQVEEVVTLDERTSSTCKVHNKKIHDIEKASILPRHPNCRCVLVPYVDVEKLTQEFERRERKILEKNQSDIDVKTKIDNLIKSGEKIDVKKLSNQEYGYLMSTVKSKGSDIVSDIKINDTDLNLISNYFSKTVKPLVILRTERLNHILEDHQDIGENLVDKVMTSINSPKMILEDHKNIDTVMFIGENSETNINVVVKLSFDNDLENSIITAFRISKKRLDRLIKKNKKIK